MRELPSLTDLFDSTRRRVPRIAGSRRSWHGAPLLLPVTGHTVKAAWFVTGLAPVKTGCSPTASVTGTSW
jgi:hypothetical protein